MSLYPEGSTDGGLRLGNVVPDFSAETTQGPIESFHEWKKDKVRALHLHTCMSGGGCMRGVCRSLVLSVLECVCVWNVCVCGDKNDKGGVGESPRLVSRLSPIHRLLCIISQYYYLLMMMKVGHFVFPPR